MAASASSSDDEGAVSDINITPLVDVVLVLLIVFMLTMPDLVGESAAMKVELPDPRTVSTTPGTAIDMKLDIFVRREKGEVVVLVGDKQVSAADVGDFIERLNMAKPEQPVIITGDSEIAYGEIVQVMDSLTSKGMQKISLNLKK